MRIFQGQDDVNADLHETEPTYWRSQERTECWHDVKDSWLGMTDACSPLSSSNILGSQVNDLLRLYQVVEPMEERRARLRSDAPIATRHLPPN